MSRPDLEDMMSSTEDDDQSDCTCECTCGSDSTDSILSGINTEPIRRILKPDATFTTVAVFAVLGYASASFLTMLGAAIHWTFYLPATFIWFLTTPGLMFMTLYVLFVKIRKSRADTPTAE